MPTNSPDAKRHGFDECGFRPVDTPCWCGWDDEQASDQPCTCTLACIPQGITSEQVCRLSLEPAATTLRRVTFEEVNDPRSVWPRGFRSDVTKCPLIDRRCERGCGDCCRDFLEAES